MDTTYLATLIGLFVILSPGLLLTIPVLSQTDITDKGIAYDASGTVTFCTGSTTTEAECKKPTDVLGSGYTSPAAVLVHALVFAAAVYLVPSYVGLRQLNQNAVLILAALFVALSPGLLLTLPALSKTNCGTGQKNVADDMGANNEFCNTITTITESTAPKCNKCTSIWMSGFTDVLPVVVHAVVFGVVVYYVSQRYF